MKAELSWYKKCRQVLPIIIISICNLTTYLVVLSIYMNTKSHLFLSNLCSSNGSHAGSLFNKENQKIKIGSWRIWYFCYVFRSWRHSYCVSGPKRQHSWWCFRDVQTPILHEQDQKWSDSSSSFVFKIFSHKRYQTALTIVKIKTCVNTLHRNNDKRFDFFRVFFFFFF